MKKQNYYSIHKNKKKRKSTLTEFQKTWKKLSPTLLKAVLLVQKTMQLAQQLKRMPKYRTGGNPAVLMGDTIEHVVSKNDWGIGFKEHPYLTDEYKKYLLSVPPMEYQNLVLGTCIDEQTEIKKEILNSIPTRNPTFEM